MTFGYSPEPRNDLTPVDVTRSPVFGPAVLNAVKDPRLGAHLVDRSIPWRAIDVPFVDELPLRPKDGDIIHFLADKSNGVFWTLIYWAGAPSTHRWHALGGTPLWSEVATSESSSSTSYTDLSTAGPAVVLPLPGDYDVEIAAHVTPPANAGSISYMSYAIGATAASDNDAMVATIQDNNGPRNSSSGTRWRRKVNLGAVTLTAKYRVSASTGIWQNRTISARPVRVG